MGEESGAPEQANSPQSAGPRQLKRQSRESPGTLTFQLCWQLHPSLQSDGNGAPREKVEDNAHQIQPPDHLYKEELGMSRQQLLKANAWA